MLTPFTLFMLWILSCWLVTLYTERPLQPAQLQDDLADVDTTEPHRLREMQEAERQLWADMGSDVVTRAQRMRHIRQEVARG